MFINAKVGSYYDFEENISVEIRSSLDPYMVFAYARDNLGKDFTLFLYLSLFCCTVAVGGFGLMVYYYSCFLSKKPIQVEIEMNRNQLK